jgi:hypothetical protein
VVEALEPRRRALRRQSPREWTGGASLVGVEVAARSAPEVAARPCEEHGLLVRAFECDLNAMRISPNVHTGSEEIVCTLELLDEAAP